MNYINIALLVLALGSGFAVVSQQNRARQQHIELAEAEKQQQELEKDFACLQLKQAELSNHQLVKRAAAKARLAPPQAADTRVVETE